MNYLDDYKKYFANFKQIKFAKCEDTVVVPVVDVASRQRIQRFYEQQVLLTSNINSEKITGQSSEQRFSFFINDLIVNRYDKYINNLQQSYQENYKLRLRGVA